MSRRVSLPGADELFRTTGGMALQPSAPRRSASGEARVPAPAGESDGAAAGGAQDAPHGRARAGRRRRRAPSTSAADAGRRAGESRSRARRRGACRAPPGRAGRFCLRPATSRASAAAQAGARRPSGRERHDEKITVYVSAEELMDLEHARLVLRGEHGLAVDRGRIVREAVAVVLADLESRGDASILVRRLRGR